MSDPPTPTVIILAAGQGTRMKSDLPKVLHEVAGRPMLMWTVEAARVITSDENIAVVIGHQADLVRAILPTGIKTVTQLDQRGTGHAVLLALEEGVGSEGVVVVVPGDTPQLRGEVLEQLVDFKTDSSSGVVLLTANVEAPTGFGRVIRDTDGTVVRIVEQRDATESELAVSEVNTSVYAFDAAALREVIGDLKTDNAQQEMYLTDTVGLIRERGGVQAMVGDADDSLGINTLGQLADVDAVMRMRINQELMDSGVKILDPSRTYIDASVTVEPGATIYPDVYLQGGTTVADQAVVGPSVFAIDSEIGTGARVWYAVLREAIIGPRTEVGPYASVRKGTVADAGAKIGTFVETKNTHLGEGAKVPHLSYIGDARVGQNSNIGAGSITCNYDGFEKHETVIGDNVRIGSDTMLVAPVEVGDGAWTGAGSVISRNVSPGALAVERGNQKEIPDYAAKRKAKADDT
ncbi:MAG: bifunctional UDP-N-acetylglucosamine diphosphorylase/glucosamine-1-phosphate N-acetyltransferase GlmU [Acidimicrobiia bacterium]|nr:bifunctional UDP-N-acetylglucosamine diphosphorylase/glucosamine-1-phosphate N-acetyltransferase GlmU [Acidimicrobiia bacterium]